MLASLLVALLIVPAPHWDFSGPVLEELPQLHNPVQTFQRFRPMFTER